MELKILSTENVGYLKEMNDNRFCSTVGYGHVKRFELMYILVRTKTLNVVKQNRRIFNAR